MARAALACEYMQILEDVGVCRRAPSIGYSRPSGCVKVQVPVVIVQLYVYFHQRILAVLVPSIQQYMHGTQTVTIVPLGCLQ